MTKGVAEIVATFAGLGAWLYALLGRVIVPDSEGPEVATLEEFI